MRVFDDDTLMYGGITLTKLFDDCQPTNPLARYQTRIREWATTYLTAPHPELGREGSVCPFTAASIEKQMFWITCVERSDLTAEDIEEVTSGMVMIFNHLSPTERPASLLKTILILFPEVADYNLIDQAQRHLKEEAIPAGLMVGQFYPGCEEPGIRNPSFRPLRSPLALLAIRHMVSSDFPFLASNKRWVEEYLKNFALSLPPSVHDMIAAGVDNRGVGAS